MAKTQFVIFNPEGGLGKIIASTALLPGIKAKYPDRKLIVVCTWVEVFVNNPHVDRAYKTGLTPYFYKDYIENRDTIILKGEPYYHTDHLYGKQHVIKSWYNIHDLEYNNQLPELFFTPNELHAYKRVANDKDKPILLFQTNGGSYENEKDYCWTRDFPFEQAQILTNELLKHFTVMQVSRPNCQKLQGAEWVNDVPNKRTLLGLLTVSSKRLLIDSCLQHGAAALQLPSTVCWIGTSPDVFGYEMHNNVLPNLPVRSKGKGAHGIDSLFFDYEFTGPEHEFPYESMDVFDLQTLYDQLTSATNLV
jgi:hypothetical protein